MPVTVAARAEQARRAATRRTVRVAVLCALLPATVPASPEESLLDLFENVSAPGPAGTTRPEDGAAAGHPLSIAVDGVSNARGTVRILAFDDETAFRTGDITRLAGYADIPAVRGRVEARFEVLGAGPWAVFAFHDENDNEQLDRHRGHPQEGYGYSGAIDPYLPPSFDQAARVRDAARVRLNYLPRDDRGRPR